MTKYILLFFTIISCTNFNIAQELDVTSVYFDYDKYDIKDKYKSDLIEITKKHKNNKIIITGYTDSEGTEYYNKRLSIKRANSVKQFLIKNGYNESNILTVSGEGEIPKGVKQFNRRVDITIQYEMVPPPEMVIQEEIVDISEFEQMSTLKIGETLALEGMNFIPGRHFLLKSSESKLLELLAVLENNPTLKIEIQGHICCLASGEDGMDADTRTMDLSVNRAKYIYDYLIKNGIQSNRLSFKGFGASKPLVEEITELDQQTNRRVEIMIIEK